MFVWGALLFVTVATFCALASIPWGKLGPLMAPWASVLGTGLGLGTATVFYVCWKKGL